MFWLQAVFQEWTCSSIESRGVDAQCRRAVVAAFANGPMQEPVCTPDHHLGDDDGGRCSVCNARLTRRDLMLVGLLLMALSAAIALAFVALAVWWALG